MPRRVRLISLDDNAVYEFEAEEKGSLYRAVSSVTTVSQDVVFICKGKAVCSLEELEEEESTVYLTTRDLLVRAAYQKRPLLFKTQDGKTYRDIDRSRIIYVDGKTYMTLSKENEKRAGRVNVRVGFALEFLALFTFQFFYYDVFRLSLITMLLIGVVILNSYSLCYRRQTTISSEISRVKRAKMFVVKFITSLLPSIMD